MEGRSIGTLSTRIRQQKTRHELESRMEALRTITRCKYGNCEGIRQSIAKVSPEGSQLWSVSYLDNEIVDQYSNPYLSENQFDIKKAKELKEDKSASKERGRPIPWGIVRDRPGWRREE